VACASPIAFRPPAAAAERFPQSVSPIPGPELERKENYGEKIGFPDPGVGGKSPRSLPDPGTSMTPLPIADWQASLAGMETALASTLGALDRYQAGWQRLLEDPRAPGPAGEGERAGPLLARLQDRLREWDDRLAAAADLAASVERQLAAAEAAAGRWHGMFTSWQELIQRGVEPAGPREHSVVATEGAEMNG
jgi:hypothetical protein